MTLRTSRLEMLSGRLPERLLLFIRISSSSASCPISEGNDPVKAFEDTSKLTKVVKFPNAVGNCWKSKELTLRSTVARDVDAKNDGGIVPLIKLDLTSKVAKLESPSNISGRLPVSVLKLAENVSRLVSALNSVGIEPNTPGFLAIVKDPAHPTY